MQASFSCGKSGDRFAHDVSYHAEFATLIPSTDYLCNKALMMNKFIPGADQAVSKNDEWFNHGSDQQN